MKKSFKELYEAAGLKSLPIPKHESESESMKCFYKFTDGNRKYRINQLDDQYLFSATKWKSRYFHGVKLFKTLPEAEDFIFTSESGDLIDEKL